MSERFREGDRVSIRRALGRDQLGVVAEDWSGGGPVMVRLDGKTKPVPRDAAIVRPVERRGPPLRIEEPTPKPTTNAKLRPVPKPRGPYRSERYLAHVRQHPCSHCRRAAPSEAHHWHPRRGAGQKVSDLRTVPLCRRCHQHFHDTGRLPELDARTTRQAFVERQAELMEAWIERRRDG